MSFLLLITKIFANLATFASRLLSKNATSLPGILVELYWPFLIKPMTKDLDYIILITGTNGKTTTRGIINHLLESQRIEITTNRGGANIMRGIATSLINNLKWNLKPRVKIAVLEVEEATLPRLAKYIRADQLIITNLLRDQLDAYGSIDQTGDYFNQSILTLQANNPALNLILNADDSKLLTFIPSNFPTNQIQGFGVKAEFGGVKYEQNIQAVDTQFVVHTATNIQSSWRGIKFDYDYAQNQSTVTASLPGLYNVYNILAGLVSCQIQLDTNLAPEVSNIQPVFGRGEIIRYKNAVIVLNLVKNPSGLDQVINLIPEFAQDFDGRIVRGCFLINDAIADGKDVSWLWDANLEQLAAAVKASPLKYEHLDFFAGGSRGMDMLLRLQTSGIPVDIDNYLPSADILIERIIEENRTNPSNFFICGTYTAMMEVRTRLGQLVELPRIDSRGF